MRTKHTQHWHCRHFYTEIVKLVNFNTFVIILSGKKIFFFFFENFPHVIIIIIITL